MNFCCEDIYLLEYWIQGAFGCGVTKKKGNKTKDSILNESMELEFMIV